MAKAYFKSTLFAFLRDLKRNNDRDWFAVNKERYERLVRDPMLEFVTDFAKPLARIAPQLVADPRPAGGSMFRIYRDTRFAKDKSPYKTHAALYFRHRAGKNVGAPGFYLHLEPGTVMGGAGLWHPEPPALAAVRAGLIKDPAGWKKAVSGKAFRAQCQLEGNSVKRPPKGIDPAHPLIDDLKRTDFAAIARWTEKDALSPQFMDRFVAFCRLNSPLMRFLTNAVGHDW